MLETQGTQPVNASNRFGVNYAREADVLGRPVVGIIDVHAHINGRKVAHIYRDVCQLFGIERVYSMSKLEEIDALQRVLGERIRFIAVPNYWAEGDRRWHMGEGYRRRIVEYHRRGARIAKFWAAPRAIDYAREMGDPDFMRLDAPHRIAAMETAAELGMIFMAHIADPDTWFATKYKDASIYGTKRDQYEPFEKLLERFPQPWIAAHMGGWPEDLEFLTGLLDAHANLYLDASATKWQVRELSRHSRDDLIEFFTRFRGRILFGSDIVTSDDHLAPSAADANEMVRKASSEDEAFDLYASRYWALRALFEIDYEGESPIADPDLAMVDPERFTEMDAPQLIGKSLPASILVDLYRTAAEMLLGPLEPPPKRTKAEMRI